MIKNWDVSLISSNYYGNGKLGKRRNRKAEELSKRLLPNLQALGKQIMRKPPQFDPRWAKSITESFTLYTRTSTVNLFMTHGECFREDDWPFPAFIDLERELHLINWDWRWVKRRFFFTLLSWRSISMVMFRLKMLTTGDRHRRRRWIDALMCRRFKRASHEVFAFWQNHPLLFSRRALLRDLIKAYKRKLWGVCVPATFPLLDYIIRDYLRTSKLTIGIGTVADAFELAGITYESLKPDSDFNKSTSEISSPHVSEVIGVVERDLRLPGIYLASFAEYARKFYSNHVTAGNPTSHVINRHAIIHGDATYWSKADAVKLLMFLDLTLKLEPVMRILLAPPTE